MKKTIFAIIIIAIVIIGGYSLINNKPEQVETATQVAEEKVITYTDAGYSPSSLQVKQGETVIFKNESSKSMWPASAMHPSHNEYPTAGGCLGSAFDACKGVQPGDSWPFQFDIAGNWKYHDHLNPKNFGAIIVQQ